MDIDTLIIGLGVSGFVLGVAPAVFFVITVIIVGLVNLWKALLRISKSVTNFMRSR